MADVTATELARLAAVFRNTPDAELHDTDVAELTGLDEDECRTLLGRLRETGVIQERRNRVYVSQARRGTSAGDDGGSPEF